MLWEFTWADDNDHRDIGYSFGNPLAAEENRWHWVVLVASGYDNGTKDS
jgi:Tfp pilus tip-associated adhesin PilY1